MLDEQIKKKIFDLWDKDSPNIHDLRLIGVDTEMVLYCDPISEIIWEYWGDDFFYEMQSDVQEVVNDCIIQREMDIKVTNFVDLQFFLMGGKDNEDYLVRVEDITEDMKIDKSVVVVFVDLIKSNLELLDDVDGHPTENLILSMLEEVVENKIKDKYGVFVSQCVLNSYI